MQTLFDTLFHFSMKLILGFNKQTLKHKGIEVKNLVCLEKGFFCLSHTHAEPNSQAA